jgi:hypothetical protein
VEKQVACLLNSCCGFVSYVLCADSMAIERICDLHPRDPGSVGSAQSSTCSCTRAGRTDRTVPEKCQCRSHCTEVRMYRWAEHWWYLVKALDRTGGSGHSTGCKNHCYKKRSVTWIFAPVHTSHAPEIRPKTVNSPIFLRQQLALRLATSVNIPELRRQKQTSEGLNAARVHGERVRFRRA